MQRQQDRVPTRRLLTLLEELQSASVLQAIFCALQQTALWVWLVLTDGEVLLLVGVCLKSAQQATTLQHRASHFVQAATVTHSRTLCAHGMTVFYLQPLYEGGTTWQARPSHALSIFMNSVARL